MSFTGSDGVRPVWACMGTLVRKSGLYGDAGGLYGDAGKACMGTLVRK